MAEAVKAHKASETAAEEKKKVQAGLQKERLQLDRALAKRRGELDKKVWSRLAAACCRACSKACLVRHSSRNSLLHAASDRNCPCQPEFCCPALKLCTTN